MSSVVASSIRTNMSLNAGGFFAGITRARKESEQTFSAMDKLAANATRLGAVMAGAFAISNLTSAADQYSDLSSRVGIAIGDMGKAGDTMKQLGSIASDTWSEMSNVAEGFIQNNQVLQDLGKSSQQALDYTESLSNALIVSGAKGEKAAAVQKALSDAMVLGKLSGDQLNRVLMDGDAVAQALAQEMGTTVTGLRQLGTEGKITSDIIANTVLKNQAKWADQAGSMPGTFGDVATAFANMTTTVVGRFDQITGASGTFATSMKGITDSVTDFANSDSFEAALDGIATAAQYAAVALAALATTQVVSVLASAAATVRSVGIAFTAQYYATTALTVATRALNAAMSFAGGPIGIITTGLSLLAMGFYKSREANEKLKQSIAEIPAKLQTANDAWKRYYEERSKEAAKAYLEVSAAAIAAKELEIAQLAKQESESRAFGMQANGGDFRQSERWEEVNAELEKAKLALDYLVAREQDANAALSETNNTSKALSAETLKQVDALSEQTSKQEHQLELMGVAQQYGEDSVQYKMAELNYERDIEAAKLAALAAQVEGNAEAEAAVDKAISVANATYDAEAAAISFAAAMARVKSEAAAILSIIARMGAATYDSAVLGIRERALAAGKTQIQANREEAEFALRSKYAEMNKAYMADATLDPADAKRVIEENNKVFKKELDNLQRGWALDDAEWATEPTKGASGGRAKGGGGGRSGGSGSAKEKKSDFEKTSEALKEKIEELTATMYLSAEAEEVWKAKHDAGVLGNASAEADIEKLVKTKQALEAQREQVQSNAAFWKDFGETALDSLSQVLAGTMSLKDALKDLGAMILKWGLTKLFGSWFDVDLGGIGKNANGTAGWGGGLTWVGERGPEIAAVGAGTKIMSNADIVRKMGNESNNNGKIPMFMVDSGVKQVWLSEAEAMSQQHVKQGISHYDKNQAPKTMRRVNNDKRGVGY